VSTAASGADGAADRSFELTRRWRRVWRDPRTQAFWKNLSHRDVSYLVGMLSWFVLLLIESPLWFPGGRPPFPFVAGRWIVALTLLAPVQGWLLDQYIELKTSGLHSVPIGWRMFRLALASFPLFGLYTLPVWRQILSLRSGWIVSKARRRGADLVLHRPAGTVSARVVRVLLSSAGFPVLIVVIHLGLPMLWACWLSAQPVGPGLLPLCGVLHLSVAACFAHVFQGAFSRVDRRSWQRSLLQGLPVLFLLGLPGMMVGFLAFLAVNPLVSRDRSLVWSAYARRSSVQTEHEPLGIQDWLPRGEKRWNRRRNRRPPRPPEKGQADGNRRAFYRLKTFLLSVDGLTLAWIVLAVQPSQERIDQVFRVMQLAAGLAILGLLLQAAGLLGRLFGGSQVSRLLEDHPYGHFLFVSQAALIAGLAVGAAIGFGQLDDAGKLLSQLSALATVVSGILLMIGRPRPSALWALLFLVLILAGVPVAVADDLSPFLPWMASGAVLINLAVGIAFGGWLLRPFGWRHVLAPGIPLRERWALAFLALTAVLPFGGLLVPCWILLRHRRGLEWERSRWRVVELLGRELRQSISHP
jgi:hypothetical protein